MGERCSNVNCHNQPTLARPVGPPSSRMFCGFRSRCTTVGCRYASPAATSCAICNGRRKSSNDRTCACVDLVLARGGVSSQIVTQQPSGYEGKHALHGFKLPCHFDRAPLGNQACQDCVPGSVRRQSILKLVTHLQLRSINTPTPGCTAACLGDEAPQCVACACEVCLQITVVMRRSSRHAIAALRGACHVSCDTLLITAVMKCTSTDSCKAQDKLSIMYWGAPGGYCRGTMHNLPAHLLISDSEHDQRTVQSCDRSPWHPEPQKRSPAGSACTSAGASCGRGCAVPGTRPPPAP